MKNLKYTVFVLILLMACPIIQAQQGIIKSKVLVASHRGDWRNYTENSVEAIESCIRMGVDIVEIDVSRTKDGHLILMHDKTVDRTTNEKGLVSDFTLEEIRQMNLRNGLGRVGEFKIPTLEEAMLAAKGKITVNLDKADKYFDEVYKILEKTGTTEQTIIKSDKSHEELKAKYGEHFEKMTFMPVVNLKEESTFGSLLPVLEKQYPYYEIVFEDENKELLLKIKDYLKDTPSIIWINSLWPSLCGGYSDDKALTNPDGTWGYLIDDLGAGILQTDRPQYMLEYLKTKGLHK